MAESDRNYHTRIILLGFMSLLQLATMSNIVQAQRGGTVINRQEKLSLGRFTAGIWRDSAGGSQNQEILVLLINFKSLACVSCLRNFLEFIDSINVKGARCHRLNGMQLIIRTDEPYSLQRRKMQSWSLANNLNFKMYLIAKDSLPEGLVDRVTLVLVKADGEIALCEPFPLSTQDAQFAIERVCRNQ